MVLITEKEEEKEFLEEMKEKWGEIRKKTKEKFKKVEEKGKFSLGKMISVFISLLVVVQAFQPLISYSAWIIGLAIAFIIVGILSFLASVFLTGGGATFFGTSSLVELGIMLLILGIIILAIAFSSSPELLKVVRIVWALNSARLATYFEPVKSINGTMVGYVVFLMTLLISGFSAYKLRSPLCYFFPFLLWFILFPLIKPALAATGLTEYVNVEKRVNVQYSVPFKTIPVEGGVSVKYGTRERQYIPATLLAGQPYIYYYSIQNLYDEEEKFQLDPYIEIKYQYATVRFRAPQKPEIPYNSPMTLGNKSFYQDQLYYNPETMTIETDNACYYTVAQIKKHYGEDFNVVCAYDKPCESDKVVCTKVGDFMCDCLGWTGLTCGGYRAYMGMNIWHTGFLRAKGTLFYKKEFFEPIANEKTVQGPFALMPVFFPNPWVEAIYNPETETSEKIENVKLSVELENTGGGKIKITNITAMPVNTEINTTVKGFSEELGDILEVTVKETLGINSIGCDDSQIVNKEIPSNVRIYKEFCNFTKPVLNVSIINIKAGKVEVSQEIKIDDVYSYCKEGLSKSLNVSEEEKEAIAKIMKVVGRTGLCEILSENETGKMKESFVEAWREKIEDSLKSVNVIFEVKYEREFSYPSRAIEVFTSTEQCLKYSCCHGSKNIICPDGWDEAKKEEENCAGIK